MMQLNLRDSKSEIFNIRLKKHFHKNSTESFLSGKDFLAVLSTGFGESSVKPCGASQVTPGKGHTPVVTPGTNKKQRAALNAIEDSSCVTFRSYCHEFVDFCTEIRNARVHLSDFSLVGLGKKVSVHFKDQQSVF